MTGTYFKKSRRDEKAQIIKRHEMKENLGFDKNQVHSKNKSLANASKSAMSILDEKMSNTIVSKHKHTPSQ